MLKKERHYFILNYISVHGTALVSVLSNTLKVSHDTIARDLRDLSKEGLLTRVHGGALEIKHKTMKNSPTTAQIIARKTLPLLRNNSFILTCGGDALMELFALIPITFKATLLTVSMQIASKYSEHPTIDVIQIGDQVQKISKTTAGGDAITKIRQIHADMCILDITAIDPNQGVTEVEWQLAQVKMAMNESSDITVCLAASSLLGKIFPVQACRPQNINYLITELYFEDPALDVYRAKGITVL